MKYGENINVTRDRIIQSEKQSFVEYLSLSFFSTGPLMRVHSSIIG